MQTIEILLIVVINAFGYSASSSSSSSAAAVINKRLDSVDSLISTLLRHSIYEGVRRVVSSWNFVRLYGLMMGSRDKILESGGTSYGPPVWTL